MFLETQNMHDKVNTDNSTVYRTLLMHIRDVLLGYATRIYMCICINKEGVMRHTSDQHILKPKAWKDRITS